MLADILSRLYQPGSKEVTPDILTKACEDAPAARCTSWWRALLTPSHGSSVFGISLGELVVSRFRIGMYADVLDFVLVIAYILILTGLDAHVYILVIA